jgi:hypothetical protein
VQVLLRFLVLSSSGPAALDGSRLDSNFAAYTQTAWIVTYVDSRQGPVIKII